MHHVPHASNPPVPPARPVEAVLFDFHGTLAQVEDALAWVVAAAAACGTELDRGRATILADRLTTAGRAGGPLPHRVPPHLAEHWADRDLYAHSHRAAYTGLAATVPTDVEGLADALYERLLVPDGWVPYPDAEPTLRSAPAPRRRRTTPSPTPSATKEFSQLGSPFVEKSTAATLEISPEAAYIWVVGHGRQATGTVAELEKEDEIPQQRVITTSPARQEVIAADAHHSGRLLAARSRSTTCAGTVRHQN
ncbi:hypothetical protein [Actinoplanes philippinensis]|uniref:hypothetical protein n=1 Tax=Actinoplanes philippinensis TaxID=35752 RepID=UPI003F4CEB75